MKGGNRARQNLHLLKYDNATKREYHTAFTQQASLTWFAPFARTILACRHKTLQKNAVMLLPCHLYYKISKELQGCTHIHFAWFGGPPLRFLASQYVHRSVHFASIVIVHDSTIVVHVIEYNQIVAFRLALIHFKATFKGLKRHEELILRKRNPFPTVQAGGQLSYYQQ